MLAYIPYPSWIHPQIVPFLPLRWYGLMYVLAFAITYLLFMYQVRQRKLEVKADLVLDMFFWAILGLLVGARAFSVLIYTPRGFYLQHPLQIILPFAIVNGRLQMTGIAGMSYHGGLVGAVIALVIYMRVKKLSILDWGDMLVAGIPLGYTFGRLGNFINAELYGRVTTVPWGMVFPGGEVPAGDPGVKEFASALGIPTTGAGFVNLPRHPSQLYEALFEGIVLWLILWFIVRRRKPYNGFVIACYMIGYGVFRFFIEYAREPDKGIGYPITLVPLANPAIQFSPFNFTTGQILNVLLVAGAVIAMAAFKARAQRALPEESAPRPTGRKLRKKLK